MEFTQEQAQELFANEETRGIIFETLAQNESGKQYLNTHAENYFEEKVKSRIGEIHGMYDRDFEEATGIKKPDGVKSYEFWKSQFSDLHSKAQSSDPTKLAELQKANEELKSKLEGDDSSKYFKDLYESTKSGSEKRIAELEEQIAGFKKDQVLNTIKSDLNNSLKGLAFDKNIKQSVLDTYIQNVTNSLVNNAKVLEDGSIAYYNAEQELITNNRTMEKAKAIDILKKSLADVLEDKRVIEGGGEIGQGKTTPKPSGNYSKAKTQGELIDLITENLMSDGMVKGSADFQTKMTKLFQEHGKDLPMR